MYVERELAARFRKVDPAYPIVAVVGPRQAGKTTFLRRQMRERDASYVLLDDPDARELFETDIKKFDTQYVEGYEVAVLDEVQGCSGAGRKLKYLADSGRRLWITSSSEMLLRKEVLSHLVGRVSIHALYPFNFTELCRAKGQEELTASIWERLVWEHVAYGGYPAVVTAEDVGLKKDVLRNLYETMLLKDVAQTFSIGDVTALERLTRYLSQLVGEMVQYETVSNELDMTFKTVKKYLSALEQSYVVQRIQPFHTNKRKELVKRPKLYFLDTGLRNAVAGEFSDTVSGELFENYVFTELWKQGYSPRYWRTKDGAEVDFVVGKERLPLEVKKAAAPDTVPSGLRSFIRRYDPSTALIIRYEMEERAVEYDGCTVRYTNPSTMEEYLP